MGNRIVCRVIGRDFEAESVIMQLREADEGYLITVAKDHQFIEKIECPTCSLETAEILFKEVQIKYFGKTIEEDVE